MAQRTITVPYGSSHLACVHDRWRACYRVAWLYRRWQNYVSQVDACLYRVSVGEQLLVGERSRARRYFLRRQALGCEYDSIATYALDRVVDTFYHGRVSAYADNTEWDFCYGCVFMSRFRLVTPLHSKVDVVSLLNCFSMAA